MNYILFDGDTRNSLLPFTFTRPVADIRIGILTIREKWEKHLGTLTSTITEEYLSQKFPLVKTSVNVLINGSFLPNGALATVVKALEAAEAIYYEDELVAYSTEDPEIEFDATKFRIVQFEEELLRVQHTWDIFSKNGEALQADFDLITSGRKSAAISETNSLINPGEYLFRGRRKSRI